MNKLDYKNIKPFKWFVLQNFPFIEEDFDAITNWQLFCKLGDEINKVINNMNLVGTTVEEFTEYISNYFDNLDVQDEVNNKLDEMAESGELTEIIAQYLQLAGILAFNTVSDMSDAENLINGSFAKTYGKVTYNDGLGAFYKIRTILNTDVIDGDNLVALTNFNTLVAEKMPDANITDIYTKIGTLANLTTTEKTNLVGAINELKTDIESIDLNPTLKGKNILIMGDSLCITGRWGTYFATYCGGNCTVAGNGSAGFCSKGVTSPYENMNFEEMLDYILTNMTTAEKNALDYLILGGGINDALNSYTTTQISTNVQSFITKAKTNFPNAKLIIFPLHTFKWLTNVELGRYQAIIDTVTNNGIMTTSDFLWWTVDSRTYDEGDHTHLTDAGYQLIAHKILSFVNGSNNNVVEQLEFTLEPNWNNVNFSLTKIGNIVYAHGQLNYTGGAVSSNVKIASIAKGAYLTGTSGFNFYMPCIMYSGGSDAFTTISFNNGEIRSGRPANYTALGNPYYYINGSFIIGIQGI